MYEFVTTNNRLTGSLDENHITDSSLSTGHTVVEMVSLYFQGSNEFSKIFALLNPTEQAAVERGIQVKRARIIARTHPNGLRPCE